MWVLYGHSYLVLTQGVFFLKKKHATRGVHVHKLQHTITPYQKLPSRAPMERFH